jgi:two-component system response regulator YesN
MYKILVVDDEPPFIRSVVRVIEKNTSGFQVCDFAYNGKEALEKIHKNRPDVVITDIKMPIMDGIELIKNINRNYPDIQTVILSGYQDFEYAKQALKARAVDYLLKPIEPKQITKLMESIYDKLVVMDEAAEQKALYSLSLGEKIEDEVIKKYFNYKYFCISIVLEGLYLNKINRFNFQGISVGHSLQDILGKYGSGFDKTWSIRLIGTKEILVLYAYNNRTMVSEEIKKIFYELESSRNNITLGYSESFEDLNHLPKHLNDVEKAIKNSVIINKSTLVSPGLINYDGTKPKILLDNHEMAKIEVLTHSKMTKGLMDEVQSLINQWEQEKNTQISVERTVRQILTCFQRNSNLNFDLLDYFDEVLPFINGYEDILNFLNDIINEAISGEGVAKSSRSTQELFKSIELYVKSNINKMISISDVCSHIHISQSYLCKIVRENKNMSFNEYVTKEKINVAKNYLSKFTDMLIKDVAEIVGYEDQHYFSRVFKQITGYSPSEYREKCCKN